MTIEKKTEAARQLIASGKITPAIQDKALAAEEAAKGKRAKSHAYLDTILAAVG